MLLVCGLFQIVAELLSFNAMLNYSYDNSESNTYFRISDVWPLSAWVFLLIKTVSSPPLKTYTCFKTGLIMALFYFVLVKTEKLEREMKHESNSRSQTTETQIPQTCL